jgi:biotin-dependent carboxylase-like uncharacterized protein
MAEASELTFRVVAPGPLTTIQDCGRIGIYRDGVPPGGAQDLYALRAANAIVGNDLGSPLMSPGPRGAAGLEVTMHGLRLEVLRDTAVAVTGACDAVRLNGEPVAGWMPIAVAAGDEIRFGMPSRGVRAYLAVGGGIDVPLALGSRSTVLRCRIGGLGGRAVREGDVLATFEPHGARGGAAPPESIRPILPAPVSLRVVLGPQVEMFTDVGVNTFTSAEWTMLPASDRMGFRFSGPELTFRPRPSHLSRDGGANPSNIVDDPIPPGGIQVPQGNLLIAMGVDGPSAGGFAKIASVITPDMSRLAQLRPGETAVFEPVTVDRAGEIVQADELGLRALAGCVA